MNEVFLIFTLLASIYLLVKSSDLFVESAVSLANHFKVKDFLIGVTIIAVGTSLPELISGLIAASKNSPQIILGTVIGSNIANTSLIIGVCSIIGLIVLRRDVVFIESIITLLVTVLLGVLVLVGIINFLIGVVMLISYFLYILWALNKHSQKKLPDIIKPPKYSISSSVFILIISLIGIWAGAELVVTIVKRLSQIMGFSEHFIAGTILAVGTSLPELSVGIQSVRKKKSELLLGNILGSNIANVLLVLSSASLITPIIVNAKELYFITLMLFIIAYITWHVYNEESMGVKQGIVLLFTYVVFLLIQFNF